MDSKVSWELISKEHNKANSNAVTGAQLVRKETYEKNPNANAEGFTESETYHMKLNASGDELVYQTEAEKFAISTDTVKGW